MKDSMIRELPLPKLLDRLRACIEVVSDREILRNEQDRWSKHCGILVGLILDEEKRCLRPHITHNLGKRRAGILERWYNLILEIDQEEDHGN